MTTVSAAPSWRHTLSPLAERVRHRLYENAVRVGLWHELYETALEILAVEVEHYVRFRKELSEYPPESISLPLRRRLADIHRDIRQHLVEWQWIPAERAQMYLLDGDGEDGDIEKLWR